MPLNAVRGARGNQKVKHLVHGDRVEFGPHPGDLEQRLDLGREGQRPAGEGVVDRPHAHPVAGEDEPVAPLVPQGEGEVAVERLDAGRAALLVEVDDHLGVRGGPEGVAAAAQLVRGARRS